MLTRYFALGIGITYLLVGLLGFIPGTHPMTADMPDIAVDALYGKLLGLFPVNILHNIVHLLVGAAGLASYRSFAGARNFARGLAIFYAILAVGAFIPGLNTMFGLIPIYGIADFLLHAATAAVAAYFGFVAPAETTTAGTTTRRV